MSPAETDRVLKARQHALAALEQLARAVALDGTYAEPARALAQVLEHSEPAADAAKARG